MKATELRIGNIVDLGSRIAKIIEIGYSSWVVVDLEKTQDTIEDYERVQGLVLIDEWFEKFGFYKEGDISKYWTLNNVDIWELNGGFANDLDIPIQYIHQLQNLYFALTNEELTIKED